VLIPADLPVLVLPVPACNRRVRGETMTRIEWTNVTRNPVTGCSPVSAGCANCYAAVMARRLAGKVKNQPPDLTAGEFNRGE